MQDKLLIKNYTATTTISKNRAVELVTGGVAQVTAATDFIIGIVHPELDAVSGGRVDVVQQGITQAEAGAAIALGAFLTTDSQGRLITRHRRQPRDCSGIRNCHGGR